MKGGYKDFATCFFALIWILGSILVIPSASASVTELQVTPKGDTITISGKASPGEEVWVSSSFEISLPVSDDKYSRKFKDIYFPAGKKRFTVTAENVEDIRISLSLFPFVQLTYPLDGPKTAIDGRATISISLPITINGDEINVEEVERDVEVYGDALEGATVVNLQTKSELQVTAGSDGYFGHNLRTKGVPEGEFVISAGGIKKTVYLGVTPPTPTPTPHGNEGPDTTPTPSPSPSPAPSPNATGTPSPSPSPSPSQPEEPGIVTVRVGDVRAGEDLGTTVTITINNVGGEGLSSARMNLTFDPEIVKVLSAENSEFDEFESNIEKGRVRMVGYQTGAEGLKGDVVFAELQLKAIGKEGTMSELGVEVAELSENVPPPGKEITDFVVEAGSFTIATPTATPVAEPGDSKPLIPTLDAKETLAIILGSVLVVLLKRRR